MKFLSTKWLLIGAGAMVLVIILLSRKNAAAKAAANSGNNTQKAQGGWASLGSWFASNPGPSESVDTTTAIPASSSGSGSTSSIWDSLVLSEQEFFNNPKNFTV